MFLFQATFICIPPPEKKIGQFKVRESTNMEKEFRNCFIQGYREDFKKTQKNNGKDMLPPQYVTRVK